MRLLLIEDNDDISKMMAQYLRLKGYDCIITNNGKDGLDQILAKNCDIALLDLAMPEFSGYDVIESLEVSGKLRERKIIVLTESSITVGKMREFEKIVVLSCLKNHVHINELVEYIK